MKTTWIAPKARICLLGIALLLSFGMVGCNSSNSTKPPEEFAPPTNLYAINGSEQITVHWASSPDEGLTSFSHYNVYRGTSSLLSVGAGELEQLGHKIGSVSAGVNQFSSTVANGTLYYLHVRAEDANGDLSGASNEVQAAGVEQGEGKILEEFEADGDSGFDFSTGNSVSLGQDSADRFVLTDIYLGTGAVDDTSTAVLSLKSPALLSRLDSRWTTQIASIKFLGTNWDANTTPDAGFASQIDVLEGAVYAIKTPSGNYAKLRVDLISGSPGSRSITFRYSYQPTPNLIQF